MKGLARFFENLLFPPRCASCHGLMQRNVLDLCESPFCDRCRLAWEREKGESCPDCGFEMLACRCYPARMKKAGISDAIKLVSYRTDRETAGRRAILYMKKHLNGKGFDFFAEQLSYPVKKYMEEHGLSEEQVAFCHVPRGRGNLVKYGFDQSEQLCRRLAACCGAQAHALIFRTAKKDVEQKKLSAKERTENTENKFEVDEVLLRSLAGKVRCLFLLDDVMTTGASLRSCAKQIVPHYKDDIVAVAIARTPSGRRSFPF